MMFRFIFLVSLLSLIFISCKDDIAQNPDQTEIDEIIILEYILENNLDATKHSSGLFYILEAEGEGDNPDVSSHVTVNYSGFLIDGTEIGSDTLKDYLLSDLIKGWQIGIPLIKPDGKAKLLLPSELGYGNRSLVEIPPNSVLIFDVELIDFK